MAVSWSVHSLSVLGVIILGVVAAGLSGAALQQYPAAAADVRGEVRAVTARAAIWNEGDDVAIKPVPFPTPPNETSTMTSDRSMVVVTGRWGSLDGLAALLVSPDGTADSECIAAGQTAAYLTTLRQALPSANLTVVSPAGGRPVR